MASSFGGTVKLTGESEYSKALKNINSNLKVLSSEIKLTSSSFDKNSASIDDLTRVNDVLNKKLDEQKRKVIETKEALEDSKQKYGENSEATKKWQIALNNAQEEVNKTSKEIDNNKSAIEKMEKANVSNTAELKEFEKAEASAGNQTLKLGDLIKSNLISEGIIAGIKGLVSSMKSLGSAMIEVGKQAVAGFGEFEQLEGGVTKLFGEDVKDTVISNANDAFKTAGMSANEYMETVTGFSKSMIVSLNGDTKKAAELSDQAIRDMSDNANTFGTDIQSIQNAYSGFAKGQFNMLDNLKLGYGGTKTEMERLLADAEKLSGKKYDISNFADITEAIHQIQVASKIAGTTQAEAMGTIEGSINATKSAWSNLITGLATDGANLSQLVMNLFSALVGDGGGNGGVVNNVLAAVEKVVDAVFEALPMILDGIGEQLPSFLDAGSNIITKLVQGLTNNMPMIMSSVMDIINMLISTITQNLPQILQMGIQMIVSLVQGIAQQLPTLIPQMIDAVVSMVDTLLDNIDLIIDAGIQLILGLADGLINALPDLIDKIPVIIDKLIIAITDNLPKIIEAGVELTIKLAVGIVKAIPQLVSKIPQIITSLVNGIGNYFGKMISIGGELLGKVKTGITNGISGMLDIGKNLVQGLWNGINNAKDWVLDKIKGFGKSILNGIKSFFGIHSPSTMFRDEIGTNMAKGIGIGFEEEMQDVSSTIQSSLPTDFDISPNVKVSSGITNSIGSSDGYSTLVNAFRDALDGMAFKVDGDKLGELIVNDVERVIYS